MSKTHPPTSEHNYIDKLKRRLAAGNWQQGGLYHILIYHDDSCAVFRGQYCSCDAEPEVVRDPGSGRLD